MRVLFALKSLVVDCDALRCLLKDGVNKIKTDRMISSFDWIDADKPEVFLKLHLITKNGFVESIFMLRKEQRLPSKIQIAFWPYFRQYASLV